MQARSLVNVDCVEGAKTLREKDIIMLMSFCTLSVLVRRCFLAREEVGEAVYWEEQQGPAEGKYMGEADPCFRRQPERKGGVEWNSNGIKEEILSNRVGECGRTNDREEAKQREGFAEIDLLKKLEEEGIPDVIKEISKDTNLFCIYDESDSDEDIQLI